VLSPVLSCDLLDKQESPFGWESFGKESQGELDLLNVVSIDVGVLS